MPAVPIVSKGEIAAPVRPAPSPNPRSRFATAARRPRPRRPWRSPLAGRESSGWLAGLLLLIAVGGRRWAQQGGLPSGPDGGQWLALGRGLFGGEGRSAVGAYPPLVPGMVEGLDRLIGPLDGLRVVAVGSLLAVVAAFLVVARGGLGWWLGLGVTAALAGASALAEPMAFGGYPQQVGLAALLIAAWCLARFLVGGRVRNFAGAATALGGAALAHHIYFPLTLIIAGAVWVGWLASRPPREMIAKRSVGAALAAGVGLACFLPTALAFWEAGYAAPLDAAGLDTAAAFRYGTREWPGLWAAIIALGVIGLGVGHRRRGEPGWLVGTSLVGVAGIAFAASGEPRLLPPLLAGGLLGVGFGLLWVWEVAAGGARLPDPSLRPGDRERDAAISGGASEPLLEEIGSSEQSGAQMVRLGSGDRGIRRAGPCPFGAAQGRPPIHALAAAGAGETKHDSSPGVRLGQARAHHGGREASDREPVPGTGGALARALVVAVAVALPTVVWARADGYAGEFFRYYRVVDRGLLAAAAAVEGGDAEGLVVVRHDRRGWPLGWWFEGLTEAPIVVGSDPRWLGFPAERAGAALAGRFFDQPLTGAEVEALARETGVTRLVFRKREWIGWQRWLAEPEPAVQVVHDDGVFMVVEAGSG